MYRMPTIEIAHATRALARPGRVGLRARVGHERPALPHRRADLRRRRRAVAAAHPRVRDAEADDQADEDQHERVDLHRRPREQRVRLVNQTRADRVPRRAPRRPPRAPPRPAAGSGATRAAPPGAGHPLAG